VVGSPFGELEPLHLVLGGLSRWIEAPVVVAHHLGPSTSLLADVLDRGHRGGAHTLSGGLPVRWAVDGGTVEPGVIHLCPPQSLVRWEPGDTFTVRRLDGRSSFELLDEMLSSAADALGSTLLAVVLTGAGSDGTTGARAVWDAGGAVVAEDAEGAASELPNRVIGAGLADVVLPLPEISKLLNRVIGRGAQLPLPDRHRRAALVTCEIRATADPGNADYQRDLAFTHDKLGDLADAIGDDTAADQHHRSALSIREWLAAAHPDRPEYQRDLATSHDKLGDADEFGHEGTAEHHYRAALTIRERLAAAHPDNAVPDADVTDVTELCIRPAPR
jgi:hypothetical protein